MWSLCGVAHTIVESSAISNKTREINHLFPLYTYPTEQQLHLGMTREPNLDESFIRALGSSLGLDFISDNFGDLQRSFGPEDVFSYIYAVLHSRHYRRRYADFLKSDFPRVPSTCDRGLFASLVAHGKRLLSLHLMESKGDQAPAFLVAGENVVDSVQYAPPSSGIAGRVFINRDQHFEGIEPEIWDFTVGSYRPAEKWLKDRKGRVLSDRDIEHYCEILAALTETDRLMAKVDEVIEQHGGWPNAFQ